MKTEIRKVYQCEFCKRNMLSAGAMSRHEKWCKNNPHNKHICFGMCQFLNKIIVVDKAYDVDEGVYHTEFICEKTGNKMYSYLLEKRLSPEYKKIPEGLIRMPLKCDIYNEMSYEEQCKRFDI